MPKRNYTNEELKKLVGQERPLPKGTLVGTRADTNMSQRLRITGYGWYDARGDRHVKPARGRVLMYEGDRVKISRDFGVYPELNARGKPFNETVLPQEVTSIIQAAAVAKRNEGCSRRRRNPNPGPSSAELARCLRF